MYSKASVIVDNKKKTHVLTNGISKTFHHYFAFSILGSQITTVNTTKFPTVVKKMKIMITMTMMTGLMTVNGLTTMHKKRRYVCCYCQLMWFTLLLFSLVLRN